MIPSAVKGLLRPGFEPGSVTFEFRIHEISLKRVSPTRGHYAFPVNSDERFAHRNDGRTTPPEQLLVSEDVLGCESDVRSLYGMSSSMNGQLDRLLGYLRSYLFDNPP